MKLVIVLLILLGIFLLLRMAKITNKRAVVSFVLLITFIFMPLSGILVHLKHGETSSHTWLHWHFLSGVVFFVAGIFHVIYNWKALKNYLLGKNNKKP